MVEYMLFVYGSKEARIFFITKTAYSQVQHNKPWCVLLGGKSTVKATGMLCNIMRIHIFIQLNICIFYILYVLY